MSRKRSSAPFPEDQGRGGEGAALVAADSELGPELAASPRKVARGQEAAAAACEYSLPSVAVSIKDAEAWRECYTRTRHKNLRCFPACLEKEQHSEHSFCGRPVYAFVSVPLRELKDELGLAVFAEMCLSDKPRRPELGEPVAPAREATSRRKLSLADTLLTRAAHGGRADGLETSSRDGLVAGEFEQWDEGSKRWLVRFDPPGRWRYHFKLAKNRTKETHVLSVFLTSTCGASGAQTCLARADSKPFRIASAWRRLDSPNSDSGLEQPAAGSDSEGENVYVEPTSSGWSASRGERVRDDDSAGQLASSSLSPVGCELPLDSKYGEPRQDKAPPGLARELAGAQVAALSPELFALHVYAGLSAPLNTSRLPRTLWPPPPLLLERRQVTLQASLEQLLGQESALVPGPARQLDLDLLSVLRTATL